MIPVQTLGYPRGLVLRNVCPQWWMGSRYQWECWNGLSDALQKSEAPGWEMRPCPVGTCRSLGEGIASLGRELSRWDLGCAPVCCSKSCNSELLQSWLQEQRPVCYSVCWLCCSDVVHLTRETTVVWICCSQKFGESLNLLRVPESGSHQGSLFMLWLHKC